MAALGGLALISVYLLAILPPGPTENILGTKNDEFDFDGLPGAMHEFKIEVGPGSEDCFYQRIRKGASFHVSFEVSVRG